MFSFSFQVAVLLFIAAVAVKQSAYILMHGSIFEPLRNWIGSKMDDDTPGFEKLNELFTCKVCMTTQVAIWLIAVPFTFSGLLTKLSWYSQLAAGATVAFAVSGLAVWFWNLSEYKVDKFENLRKSYEERIAEMQKLLDVPGSRTLQGSAHVGILPTRLTEVQFARVIEHLETSCRGIGCGYRRRDCREDSLSGILSEMVADGELSESFPVRATMNSMGVVLKDYFRDRWKYKHSPHSLTKFRNQTFSKFQRLVA